MSIGYAGTVTRVALTALVLLGLGSAAVSQETPAPPPAAEGANEMIEALVVLASKAEREDTDTRLAELAPILKTHFGDRFNVFKLHGSPRNRVKQDEKEGIRMSLIGNYYLRVVLEGVTKEADQPEMVRLEIRLTQMVKREGEEKSREVAILGPMKLNFQRDKYFPIGGPVVDGQTMIVFLRVAK